MIGVPRVKNLILAAIRMGGGESSYESESEEGEPSPCAASPRDGAARRPRRRRSSEATEKRAAFMRELAAVVAVDASQLSGAEAEAFCERVATLDVALAEREGIATKELADANALALQEASEVERLRAEIDTVVGVENGVLHYVLSLRKSVTKAHEICGDRMRENDELMDDIEHGEARIADLLEPQPSRRPFGSGRTRAPGSVGNVGTSVNPFDSALALYQLPM